MNVSLMAQIFQFNIKKTLDNADLSELEQTTRIENELLRLLSAMAHEIEVLKHRLSEARRDEN